MGAYHTAYASAPWVVCREAETADVGAVATKRAEGKVDPAMQRKLEALRLDVGEAALRDSTHATVDEGDELQVCVCVCEHVKRACGRARGRAVRIVIVCGISTRSHGLTAVCVHPPL